MPEIVIVVDVDVQGRTLGEVEADLMSKVRAALLRSYLQAVVHAWQLMHFDWSTTFAHSGGVPVSDCGNKPSGVTVPCELTLA